MSTYFKQSSRILWYQRRQLVTAIAILLLASVVFSVIVLSAAPQYKATTTLTILPSDFEMKFTSSKSGFLEISNPAVLMTQTHTEFLLSRKFASRVADELMKSDLLSSQEQTPLQRMYETVIAPAVQAAQRAYCYIKYLSYTEPSPTDLLIAEIQRRVAIETVPRSYIMNISITWNDPVIAQRAANILAQVYIDEILKENQTALLKVKNLLKENLRVYHEELLNLEEKIKDFKNKSDIPSFQQFVSLRLDELTRYTEAKNRLELKLLDLETKMDNFKNISSQSENLSLKADLACTQQSLEKVKHHISRIQSRLDQIPTLEYDLFELQQNKDDIEKKIAGFHEDLVKASVAETGIISSIKIIDSAIKPLYPESPNLMRNAIVAIIIGIILLPGILILREYASPRIRTGADISQPMIRYIGSIPSITANGNGTSSGSGRTKKVLPVQTSRGIINKHIQYITGQILQNNAIRALLIDTLSGPDQFIRVIDKLCTALPGKSVIVNLDANFHKAFSGLYDQITMIRAMQRNFPVDALYTAMVTLTCDYLCYTPKNDTILSHDDVTYIAELLAALKQKYSRVVIIAQPIKSCTVSAQLAGLVDQVVLLLKANEDQIKELAYYRERHLSVKNEHVGVITDVEFRDDYLFY